MSKNKFRRLGEYVILEKLSSGGMAEIYLARHATNEISKFVVVKSILPQYAHNKEFVSMFLAEAKLLMNLSHSNIVPTLQFHDDEHTFLVMEFVGGQNLRQILKLLKQNEKSFEIPHAVYIAKEIASGLHAAHCCMDNRTGRPLKIIHRDVSPQNIMVGYNEGEVRLIDFGIAKAGLDLDQGTKAGTIKGKFSYMSPEQASGAADLDSRTDVFSLGIILWELLSGKRLFLSKNEIATLEKVKACQIPSLLRECPGIPEDLNLVVEKALAKNLDDRYQTADEFQRALSKSLVRNYPDFLPQNFANFIKEIYADKIIALRKKKVFYTDCLNEKNYEIIDEATSENKPTQSQPQKTPPEKPTAHKKEPKPSPEASQQVALGKDFTTKLENSTSKKAPRGHFNPQYTSASASAQSSVAHTTTQASKETSHSYHSQSIVYRPPKKSKAPLFMTLLLAGVLCVGGLWVVKTGNLQRLEDSTLVFLNKLRIQKKPIEKKVTVPKKSKIYISSTPSGASIYVNGKPTEQTTPGFIWLDKGNEDTISLKKSNYHDLKFAHTVESQNSYELTMNKMIYGFLDLDVTPAFHVKVYIGDKEFTEENLPLVREPAEAEKTIVIKAVHQKTGKEIQQRIYLKDQERKKVLLSF